MQMTRNLPGVVIDGVARRAFISPRLPLHTYGKCNRLFKPREGQGGEERRGKGRREGEEEGQREGKRGQKLLLKKGDKFLMYMYCMCVI